MTTTTERDFEARLRQHVAERQNRTLDNAAAMEALADKCEGDARERKLQSALAWDRPRCNSPAALLDFINRERAYFMVLRGDPEWKRGWIEHVANRVILDEAIGAAVDDGCPLPDELPGTFRELVNWCQRETKGEGVEQGDDPDRNSEGRPKLSNEAHALAMLVQHPDWTDTQIADAVGVNRTTLYNWDSFKRARAELKRGRTDRPSGHRNKSIDSAGDTVVDIDGVHAGMKCRHCGDDVSAWTCRECDREITDACRECHAEVSHDE